MARTPISDKPMTDVERRRKSDAEKAKRGERRITTWISKDAAKALAKIEKMEGCETKIAVETALLHYIKE